MSVAITNVDNFFINITDTVYDVNARKQTIDFDAINGDILPLYFDKRPVSLGRGQVDLDYTTTTVDGYSPSSAAELKTIIQNLIMGVSDYATEVSRGNVPGHTNWSKFGKNEDVDSAASETIWTQGGVWTPMSSADSVRYDILTATIDSSVTDALDEIFSFPFKIPGGAYWTLEADTDTNNTFVRANIGQETIEE